MSRQSNPGPVDELRRVRVPEDTHWGADLDLKAGVLRLKGWTKEQRYGDPSPHIVVSMPAAAGLGLSRFLSAGGELDEVRVGPPSVMPRLGGPRRVNMGAVEVRWSGAFDADDIRLDAVDADKGDVRLAFEMSPAQVRMMEAMLRVRFATEGRPEYSGMPR